MKTSIFLMVFISLLWTVSSNTYAQCHLRLVGDVNGDTLADIVGFGVNQVSVALGNRDGRFAAPIDVFSNFSNADGWRVGEHLRYLADVNGDRRVDIVGFGANQVSVALGRSDGRFDPPINSFNRFTNADGWRVSEHLRYLADVNGDQRVDIVGFGENQVSVALGRTDGRFDTPINSFNRFTNADGWRIGEHLRELADVNGDGKADIVGFGANRVSVALGGRDGRFATPIDVYTRFTNADGWRVGEHLRQLADVNGDTYADIIAFGSHRVYVSLGQRDGRFGIPMEVFKNFTTLEGWNINEHLRSIADVNGDTLADIVGFGANRVSVALGRTDGRFDAPIDVFSNFSNADGWRVGEHLRCVMDLNNDRRADIIGFGTERVATALGQADGRFGAPNGVLSHFTSINGGWTTCPEQQNQNISTIRPIPGLADNDGIPDDWETAQRSTMPGLSPSKVNLILVPVILPNMTREQVQPTLEKIAEFFARMPIRNPDGTFGITVVIRWGNPLPDIYRELRGSCQDEPTIPHYSNARSIGMPAELIGKAHGVIINSCGAGGGQTSGSDWSGVGNSWHAIVHELGHQLGLEHDPRGTLVPSPFYTSIMNYDYTYGFNDDPNAAQFSSGKFRSLSLNERNLDETLPFPLFDLQFLIRSPYNFTLRSTAPNTTQVDFNRNGSFGERGIWADINGGSSVSIREDIINFDPTAGDFSLSPFGPHHLVAVYATLPPPVDWHTYAEAGLSVRNPGKLHYQIYDTGTSPNPARVLAASDVTGAPHAIEAFGKFFVTFPTSSGYKVMSFKSGTVRGQMQLAGFAAETAAPLSHTMLIRTRLAEQLYLFIWDETTKRIRYHQVIASATTDEISLGPVMDLNMNFGDLATPILSNSPIGGTWNSKTSRITLVTTTRSGTSEGRMKMISLGRYGKGWYGQSERWVMDGTDQAGTLSRPTILFDDRPTAGINGTYLIYNRYERPGLDPTLTELIRWSVGTPGVWTKQLVGNVWTNTRSAPAATLFRDDVAWGWRIHEGFPDLSLRNVISVSLKASGITDTGITDFDDVTWIATRGLRESLSSVR